MITGFAKLNPFSFAAADRDWAGSCQCLDPTGRREAIAIVSELGQQGRLKVFTCPRQGSIDG
ncbi:MAG TPA: hypothetical protein VLA32_09100, partial [Anaerolineales bacterium]|nr:hypothetical protein [Anaerolineales bacterium]